MLSLLIVDWIFEFIFFTAEVIAGLKYALELDVPCLAAHFLIGHVVGYLQDSEVFGILSFLIVYEIAAAYVLQASLDAFPCGECIQWVLRSLIMSHAPVY